MKKTTQFSSMLLAISLFTSCGGEKKVATSSDLDKFKLNGMVEHVVESGCIGSIKNGKIVQSKNVMINDFEVRGYNIEAFFDEKGQLTYATSENSAGDPHELFNLNIDEKGIVTESFDITYYNDSEQVFSNGLYEYDDNMNLAKIVSYSDPAKTKVGSTTVFNYKDGILINETLYQGALDNSKSSDIYDYEYNEDKLLSKKTTSNANEWHSASVNEILLYTYDDQNRIIKEEELYSEGGEVAITTFTEYNKDGLVVQTKKLDNSGPDYVEVVWSYNYNSKGLLTDATLNETYAQKERKSLYLEQGGIDKLVASADFDTSDYVELHEVDEFGNWTKRVDFNWGRVSICTREYTYRK